jgi:hypothetical protein
MRDCPDAAEAGHRRKTRQDRRLLLTWQPISSSTITIYNFVHRDMYLCRFKISSGR